ncbi:hypothetical protein VTK56DRAFT_4426 [Thermocarpiscus australiensis]
MAGRGDGDESQRLYPLNIPDLVFNRYEHRRLTARDIMIHRLMADFMNPSRVPPPLYDDDPGMYNGTKIVQTASGSPVRKVIHPFYICDTELYWDLELLDKMLFTAAPRQKPRLTSRRSKNTREENEVKYQDAIVQGPRGKHSTVGAHLLDLVMRHYFEMDGAAMRVWLSRAGLPHVQEGPLASVAAAQRPPPLGRKAKQLVYKVVLETQRIRADKTWTEFDVAHLRTFRPKVALQDKPSLYNGGAALPALRQKVDQFTYGVPGARKGPTRMHWLHRKNPAFDPVLPVWPEDCASMSFILQPQWADRGNIDYYLEHPFRQWQYFCRDIIRLKRFYGKAAPNDARPGGRYGRPRRRCTSEPPPGSFASADLPIPSIQDCHMAQLLFPRIPLSELDRRSRRRSLSRRYIQDMFDCSNDVDELSNTSELFSSSPEAYEGHSSVSETLSRAATGMGAAKWGGEKHLSGRLRCGNCKRTSHPTSNCIYPCGHCGAPNSQSFPPELESANWASGIHLNPHTASQCPVSAGSRCKCVAFPTFHTAERCGIPCRRDCGNPAPPGSFQHRNAMTCRARCCMCGLRGHSGRECRLQRCRCGGAHLGQDCRWNPACRVPGCGRYLCGVHCRECGSTQKPFVAWRCGKCLGFERPLDWGPEKKTRRKGRRKERIEGEEAGEGVVDEGEPAATFMPPVVSQPPSKKKETGRETGRETEREPQTIFGEVWPTENASRTDR